MYYTDKDSVIVKGCFKDYLLGLKSRVDSGEADIDELLVALDIIYKMIDYIKKGGDE